MPKRTIPLSVKTRAVNDWVSGKRSGAQICKEDRVTSGQLSQWRKEIAPDATPPGKRGGKGSNIKGASTELVPVTQGTDSPAPVVTESKKRRTPPHVQYAAAHEFSGGPRQGGKGATEVAARYGVSTGSIQAWWGKWKDQPPPPINSDEIQKGNSGVHPLNIARASVEIDEALAVIYTVRCPCGCNHEFVTRPPGLPEALITVAAHRLAGRR